MIVKFVSRAGISSARCVKRISRSVVASPNAQFLLKNAHNQQTVFGRSFTALASPSVFNTCSPVNQPILSVADPAVLSTRMLQTKGDKELVDFLEDEISAEKKTHKKLPDLSPFKADFNDAEVTLTKKTSEETIVIKFNVNNSVDTDDTADVDPQEPEEARMTSRPNFSVEIERGGKFLSLACTFAEPSYEEEETPQRQDEDTYADLFTITEISVYEGDFSDTTYSSAGDILDGNLYDLLMNMLEDRGITNEFVEKLSDFSTAYEHQRYVGLLENLKKFFV